MHITYNLSIYNILVPTRGPTPSVDYYFILINTYLQVDRSILGEECVGGCNKGDGCGFQFNITNSICSAGYFCVAQTCFACVPGSVVYNKIDLSSSLQF